MLGGCFSPGWELAVGGLFGEFALAQFFVGADAGQTQENRDERSDPVHDRPNAELRYGHAQGGDHEDAGRRPGHEDLQQSAGILGGSGENTAVDVELVILGAPDLILQEAAGAAVGRGGDQHKAGEDGSHDDGRTGVAFPENRTHGGGDGVDGLQHADREEDGDDDDDYVAEVPEAAALKVAEDVDFTGHGLGILIPADHVQLEAGVESGEDLIQTEILENAGEQERNRNGDDQNRDGGFLPDGAVQNDHQRNEEKHVKVEHTGQVVQQRHDLGRVDVGVDGGINETANHVNDQSDHSGGTGGPDHGADVIVKVNFTGHGGDVGGSGNGGDLIAEVGAADNSAGDDSQVGTDGAADTHHNNADSGNGAPGHAGEHGEDDAQQEGHRVNQNGVDEEDAVVDHHGDQAAHDKSGDQRSDDQHDQHTGNRILDALGGAFENVGPGLVGEQHNIEADHHCRKEHGRLNGLFVLRSSHQIGNHKASYYDHNKQDGSSCLFGQGNFLVFQG